MDGVNKMFPSNKLHAKEVIYTLSRMNIMETNYTLFRFKNECLNTLKDNFLALPSLYGRQKLFKVWVSMSV